MPAVTIGQVINSYEVVRKLGEGGMGTVYEAAHTKIGQRAALKVLSIDLQKQPGLLQRFLNEARILGQLNHPVIVKVSDFGQIEGGPPFYIMEFLEGESLAHHFEATRRKPGGCMGLDFAPLLADLASALAAAHRKGIVHRDLKPGNVMLVPDPLSTLGVAVKLLDFGIAKLIDDPRTQTGVHLGTPIYMAPEQIKDPSRVDGQADGYSLGVIAYEMLCGRLPYEQRETMAVLAAKSFDPPTPLSQYAPHLPAGVLTLVMNMLVRDPAQRPTVVDFENELRNLLGMPLPRQSGMHEVLEPSDPTADVPSGAINAAQAAPPTPSEQKGVGELSPSLLSVPQSLGSMPSVPVPSPPLRAAPHERTTAGAPEHLPAAALATPSAPTKPDSPRRGVFYLLMLALALGAALSATIALWPHQPPPSNPRAIAEPNLAPTLAALTAPGTASPTPPSIPAAAVPGADVPAERKPPLKKAGLPPVKLAMHVCEAQLPTESCSIVPNMVKHKRSELLDAFRKSGTRWCPGERLVLSGLPTHPFIRAAPSSLKRESAEAYALVGLLTGAAFPSEVEIRCSAP